MLFPSRYHLSKPKVAYLLRWCQEGNNKDLSFEFESWGGHSESLWHQNQKLGRFGTDTNVQQCWNPIASIFWWRNGVPLVLGDWEWEWINLAPIQMYNSVGIQLLPFSDGETGCLWYLGIENGNRSMNHNIYQSKF